MIFKNQNIGQEITIDIDNYFFYFIRPQSEIPQDEKQGITLSTIRERLTRMYPMIDNEPVIVHYRRSSNDHAHVRLQFLQELSVLDGFMIRAFLLDDQTRLSLDLARYLLTGSLHEMNRCFDEKATAEGTKQAGPWIPIMWEHPRYSMLGLADWNQYLRRWDQYKLAHPEIFGKNNGQNKLIIGS